MELLSEKKLFQCVLPPTVNENVHFLTTHNSAHFIVKMWPNLHILGGLSSFQITYYKIKVL